MTLTATEREHLASYGAVGQTLAERLRSGDANAAYQVAVLLAATASGTSETVRQLLIYATSGDHPAATELLNQPDDRAEIIRHAHSIAATASTPEIVALFTTCAHAHCPTRGTEAAGDQPVADHSQSLN